MSAPLSHTCWLMPLVPLLVQLPNVDLVCSDPCAHGSRHRRRTGFLCGNIHEIDLSRLRPLRHSRSGKPCQLPGKTLHRTQHNWLRRSLLCTDPQDLSVLLPRQKQCHLQVRTTRFSAGRDTATHGWTRDWSHCTPHNGTHMCVAAT